MTVTQTQLERAIYFTRDRKVMLSGDLASLYDVELKVLLQAVRRNIERFPPDFMFQLTSGEWNSLRSQFVTLENRGKGQHSKYLPFAFTQEGKELPKPSTKRKIGFGD